MNENKIREIVQENYYHLNRCIMNLADRIDKLEDKIKQSTCSHPPECIKFDRGVPQPIKKCTMCGKVLNFYNNHEECNRGKIEWHTEELKRLKDLL